MAPVSHILMTNWQKSQSTR